MTIGENIQRLRKQAGLTQRKLGELIGLNGRSGENHVQKWEYNIQSPSAKYLRPLCRALNCTLEQLIPPD